MLVATLAMSAFFRMLGSLSRSLEETMAPVSTLVFLYTVYAGYVLPEGYKVAWLGWVQWVNPVAWAYGGVMVNEVCFFLLSAFFFSFFFLVAVC
jgi:hypothetical protein